MQTQRFSIFRNHWLWSEVSKQKELLYKATYVNILINFLQIFTSLFVMAVYNKVIPNQAFSSLRSLAVGVSVIIIFDYLFKLTKSRLLSKSCDKIEEELQPALFRKLLSWDLQNQPKYAGASSTLIRDLESVVELFTNSSITTIINLPFVIINLLVIYLIAGPLAVVSLIICILTALSSIYYYFAINPNSEQAKQSSIEKNSVFIEALSNLETLKSIANYNFFEEKWKNSDVTSRAINQKVKQYVADASSLNSLYVALGQVGIVSLGAYCVIKGDISSGALIAAVILNGRTVQPLIQLTSLLQKFSVAKTSYEKLNLFFNNFSQEENRRENIGLSKIPNSITINDLIFQPEEVPSPILEVKKLNITSNESIGVIGSVGSGKSTLLKCLSGVLTPTKGNICYGSFDTSAINQSDLRRDVSYLGQSPGIFGGTIRENIVFDNEEFSEDDIISAMQTTGFDQVLKKFTNGLSYKLSENGRELSGGQKQILALTRAIISNPKTLILDEPTSSMDPKHEHLFIMHMKNYIRDKTFIVVTHRKPILALTKRIIVVENGKLVMDGERDEVLSKFK